MSAPAMETQEHQADTSWLDAEAIGAALSQGTGSDPAHVRAILDRAAALEGLSEQDVADLAAIDDDALLEDLFAAARQAKQTIYGRRLVLFAPLYVSNTCVNDCSYCGFRSTNRSLARLQLDHEAITREAEALIAQGHRRVLLVEGEAGVGRRGDAVDGLVKRIEAVYAAEWQGQRIRRINVNVAPLSVAGFRRLREARIGTYQLFQETYDREAYARVHRGGPKRDFDGRLDVMDRAMAAGIDDVGIGALFGLADWRFELLALLRHARHLEERYGVGPHTISVPRIEPAGDSEEAANPVAPVDEISFQKLIAILRLAVPYTGLILSTRETPETRREALALGVSQISAGSRTDLAGYSEAGQSTGEQFSLGDHRSLDEVVRDVASMGYVPSWCTACYRMGRTGADFMDLAKPGLIRRHCEPNALASLREYLIDHASPETREVGEAAIASALEALAEDGVEGVEIPNSRDNTAAACARHMLSRIDGGSRDEHC